MTALDVYAQAHRDLGRPNRGQRSGVGLAFEPAFGEAHILLGRARNGVKVDLEEHAMAAAAREGQAAFAVACEEPALPAMNKGQRARLAEGRQLLASDSRKDRQRGATMLRALNAERGRQLLWREDAARLDHTLRLAEARGEQVEVVAGFAGEKRVRISSRDGLTSLFEEGALTGLPPKQREGELAAEAWTRAAIRRNAGSLVREGFEAERTALRSQLEDRTGRGGDATMGAVERGFLAARGPANQVDVLRVVGVADPSGRAAAMLKQVVGEGRMLSAINPNGGPKARNLKALILGLDVAALVYAMPGARALLGPLVPACVFTEIDRQRDLIRQRLLTGGDE
jgi:hypothetical protein